MIRSNQGTVSIDGTVREALCDFACVVVELNRLIGERETREMFDYAIELDPDVWRQEIIFKRMRRANLRARKKKAACVAAQTAK